MAKQTAVATLKEAIRVLEIQQAEEREILKEQLKVTYESLKFVNLIKSSVNELTSSIELKNSFFGLVVSLISNYLSKKMMTGSKDKSFVKILGIMLQYGLTTVITQNAEYIRNLFSSLIDTLFKPDKERDPEPESPTSN